jgi:hypothetical protein
MFYSPKVYWQDKWVFIPAAFCVIFIVFMWVYAAVYLRPADEPLFLHYNVVFGVDLIGEWWKLLYIPFSAMSLFLVNFGLSWWVYGQDKVLGRFLTFMGAFLSAFLAFAFYLAIGLNI